MTPDGLARTHAAAFASGWPPRDFARYLEDPTVQLFGTDTCFIMLRVVRPEAEILTLATHPDLQGKGHASGLLRETLDTLATLRIEEVFLDVAEDNAAARALYARHGFEEFARRPAYYPDKVAAICMKNLLFFCAKGLTRD